MVVTLRIYSSILNSMTCINMAESQHKLSSKAPLGAVTGLYVLRAPLAAPWFWSLVGPQLPVSPLPAPSTAISYGQDVACPRRRGEELFSTNVSDTGLGRVGDCDSEGFGTDVSTLWHVTRLSHCPLSETHRSRSCAHDLSQNPKTRSGHGTTMVATLPNHSGIHHRTVPFRTVKAHLSRKSAMAITRWLHSGILNCSSGINAAKPQYTERRILAINQRSLLPRISLASHTTHLMQCHHGTVRHQHTLFELSEGGETQLSGKRRGDWAEKGGG